MPCAFALHSAFPRDGFAWLAPLALCGLFAAWMRLPVRTAAGVGYLSGLVFFALNFSWFGETAGALLGPFGFLLDVGPALIEACAFALAAAIAAMAAARLNGIAVPLAVAAGFTLTELLRSSGILGVPLYQIGAAFVDTPLAPLAAFGGVYVLTFAIALAGAALAALVLSGSRRRAAALECTAVAAGIVLTAGAAWLAWPARSLGPATIRVAAVQGNIRQSVKWQPNALALAVDRYTSLTARLHSFAPRLIVWPETVITTDLIIDPLLAADPQNAALAAQSRALRARFERLAGSLDAVIAVGTLEATPAAAYNDEVFVNGRGRPQPVYRKRQLVPFAEFLPGPAWLRVLPFASLISNFASGSEAGPFDVPPDAAGEPALRVAPLICWEADFTDLAQQQAVRDAGVYAVATDDAWFGDSDGPYAQAQIAQLRALETGRWIVRAAATGISGIVAPDGTWRARSSLDTVAVITGAIGAPRPTAYSRIGPWPVAAVLGGIALAALLFGRRRPAR